MTEHTQLALTLGCSNSEFSTQSIGYLIGHFILGSLRAPIFLSLTQFSVGKESACNTGDPDLIPWPGRSTGEDIGYSLHYFWASLVAQLVRNPSEM